MHYWQEKNMYYKIFSWQENRSALPQGFSVTSFVKISFPFIWDPSCNFKCRAVFSENTVKVCNWVGKLIEQSVIAHGLCLWKAETPGWAVGQQGFQPAPWQRRIGQVTLQSHLLSAVTGVSSFRRWTGSGDSSVWIRLPHNLPFSIFFFFFPLVCFSGGLAMLWLLLQLLGSRRWAAGELRAGTLSCFIP